MTSERKRAANRQNSARSTGPYTAQGKARVSRNALRHGLAAITVKDPTVSIEIDNLATAICGKNADPAIRARALIIAESQLTLLKARTFRVEVIEWISPMLREQKSGPPPSAPPSAQGAASDQSRKQQSGLPESLQPEAQRLKKLLGLLPASEEEALMPLQSAQAPAQSAAFEADAERLAQHLMLQVQKAKLLMLRVQASGLKQLARLDRYERRALSRRKRAERVMLALQSLAKTDNAQPEG